MRNSNMTIQTRQIAFGFSMSGRDLASAYQIAVSASDLAGKHLPLPEDIARDHVSASDLGGKHVPLPDEIARVHSYEVRVSCKLEYHKGDLHAKKTAEDEAKRLSTSGYMVEIAEREEKLVYVCAAVYLDWNDCDEGDNKTWWFEFRRLRGFEWGFNQTSRVDRKGSLNNARMNDLVVTHGVNGYHAYIQGISRDHMTVMVAVTKAAANSRMLAIMKDHGGLPDVQFKFLVSEEEFRGHPNILRSRDN